MNFPKDFVWGAATAAYQIEGANEADGKGASVWDVFCKEPGTIWKGQNGNIACDHYNRYKTDVDLMRQLGLKGYRLSISWPRVLPSGKGKINPAGIDFYSNLIDSLCQAGIEPYVTLFHWDFPYELYCQGGWLNDESSNWFAEYTRVIVDKLSDRVQKWITLNEPTSFIVAGHEKGLLAPGDKLKFQDVLRAGHNALLSHGKAVQVIRAYAKLKPYISYSPGIVGAYPATTSKEDVEAARQEFFSVKGQSCWNNAWWLDPVFLGQYPEQALKSFGQFMPPIANGDMEIISQPLDFCSFNVYEGKQFRSLNGEPKLVEFPTGSPVTAMDWHVTPEILYWAPKFLYERYGKPIMVTENGVSCLDWISRDGKVHDPNRIDFLEKYLIQLCKAINDGVDVRGYFCWALMDNFEWSEGHKQRFGLIFVDYQTQKRIIKDSGYWYKELVKSNGSIL
jgi:beta-glucosidase